MKITTVFFISILIFSSILVVSRAEDEDDEIFEKEKQFHAGSNEPPAPHTAPNPSTEGTAVYTKEFEDDERPNEDIKASVPQSPPPSEPKKTEEIPVKQEQQAPPVVISYYLEAFYIVMMVSYGANYWFGKKKNDEVAKQWGETMKRHLVNQFSKFSEAAEGFGVIKEDSNTYRIKATGRVNCVGLQAHLKLKKREDMVALLWDFVFPSYDTVVIDVIPNEQTMEPFVFAAVNKKEMQKFKRNTADVQKFASSSQIFGNIAAIGEVEELGSALLTKEILDVLSKNEKEFVSLHFSDQHVSSKDFPKSMQFVFRVDIENMSKTDPLYEMVIRYIDSIVEFRLSKHGKAKVDKHRRQIEEEKNKEKNAQQHEAAQQRKLEKIQKMKQNMSWEEKAAFEEKQKKKELKKRMKSKMLKA